MIRRTFRGLPHKLARHVIAAMVTTFVNGVGGAITPGVRTAEFVVNHAALMARGDLAFGDILIAPHGLCEATSRVDDPRMTLKTTLVYADGVREELCLEKPIIGAPMDSVSDARAVIAMWKAGAIGVVHRAFPPEEGVTPFLREWNQIKEAGANAFMSVGINDGQLEIVQKLYNEGCRLLCVDIANGHSVQVLEFLDRLEESFPDMVVMTGNVANEHTVVELARHPMVKLIRFGIGGGSGCVTSERSRVGGPNFTAFVRMVLALKRAGLLARENKDGTGVITIADGCFRNYGYGVLALSICDFLMIGSGLSALEESPGGRAICYDENGMLELCYVYSGMSSERVTNMLRPGQRARVVPEGVVRFKAPKNMTIAQRLHLICAAVRSAMSYTGRRWGKSTWNREDFFNHVRYNPITAAGREQVGAEPPQYRPTNIHDLRSFMRYKNGDETRWNDLPEAVRQYLTEHADELGLTT
jgi:IMP dehydrogenase